MLRFQFQRVMDANVRAKCRFHPRYDPAEHGMDGIVESCPGCDALYGLFIAGLKVDVAYGEFEGDLYALLSSQFARKYLRFKGTSHTGTGIVSLNPKTNRRKKASRA